MRVRFVYSKRGLSCFVPHIALAQIFSRSVIRAGLLSEHTQGFTQRAKISFAPELPAGVIALNELVDMWLKFAPENILDLMNDALPDGFRISRVIYPADDSPSLGKICRHAEYLLRCKIDISERLQSFYNDNICKLNYVNDFLRVIIKDPSQNPIGAFVRDLITNNNISGWHEINIVRASIGIYNPESDCVEIA